MGMLLRCMLLLVCSVYTHAEFLKDVKDFEWTLDLGSGSSIEKGNGVVVTPDGQHLLVTTSEGRFHSVPLPTGGDAPKESSIVSLDPPENTVACTSEPVLLVSDPTVVVYAVHAPSCLLYTSPSPRDLSTSRMPSSA